VKALLEHIGNGSSVVLLGEAGMGKTAVLRAVAEQAQQTCGARVPIYCKHAFTMKMTLKSLAEALLNQCAGFTPARQPRPSSESNQVEARSQSLSTLSIRKLRRLVMPCLLAGQYAVLLDHVGSVRGAYATFLDELVEDLHVPIVVAVRSLDPQEIGRLWWVGWMFAKIKIPALTPSEARQLIENTLSRSDITLPDREEFIKELSRLAKGNPHMITSLCEMARSPRYQLGGRTDLRLLLLDFKMHDLQERIDAESRIPLKGPVTCGSS
jgi:Cdc6-like AAA superfamily ATPase